MGKGGNGQRGKSGSSNGVVGALGGGLLSNGKDVIIGTDDADILNGGNGKDDISGGKGNDQLSGGNGKDIINGGDGEDILRGGHGDDILTGGDGNDTFVIDANGNGTDTITDFQAGDMIDASAVTGADGTINIIDDGSGSAQILNQDGDILAILSGVAASDLVLNEDGTISFAIVSNPLFTDNDDTVDFNSVVAGDYVDGTQYHAGDGNDTVVLANDAAAAAAAGYVVSTAFRGGDGDDTITGGGLDDEIHGDDDNDTLIGGGGGDTLSGGDGNDDLYGKTGSDVLNGGAGDDRLVGDDVQTRGLYGQFDVASYADATAAITANLSTTIMVTGDTSVGTDTLVNIDRIDGSDFNDTFNVDSQFVYAVDNGTSSSSIVFQGGAGNDTISSVRSGTMTSYRDATSAVTVDLGAGTATGDASVGSDTLNGVSRVEGSAYNDTLLGSSISANGLEWFRGNAGDDYINGYGRGDLADYYNSPNAVVVNLGAGTASDGWGSTDTLVNIENVRDSQHDDILIGSNGSNSFALNAGADYVDGGFGIDRLDYTANIASVSVDLSAGSATDGYGNIDTFINIENVRGSQYDDTLIGDGGNNHLYGQKGNDILNGGAGVDTANYSLDHIFGSGGIDVDLTLGITIDGWGDTDTLISIENVRGTTSDDVIIGDNGNNFLLGNSGDDILFGGLGNDNINGGNGNDKINGGDGDDSLHGQLGADEFDGGDGFDHIGFHDVNGISIDLVAGTAIDGDGSINLFSNIESFSGSDAEDTYLGDGGDFNVFHGDGGNDTIIAGSGESSFLRGGSGDDYIDGGDGSWDFAAYTESTEGVQVDLNLQGVGQFTSSNTGIDTLIGIEGLRGSEFGDNLVGDGNRNALIGIGGNDTLIGNGGNDDLYGGAGDDYIDGGIGDWDTATYWDSTDGVHVDLNLQGLSQFVSTGSGNDTLVNIENIAGSNFDDTVIGDSNANNLWTGTGNDTLIGGDGNDGLNGNEGNDTITAGEGSDWMMGGDGDDLFIFNVGDGGDLVSSGGDTIQDFSIGIDHLILNDGMTITGVTENDWNGDSVTDSQIHLSSGDWIEMYSVSGIVDTDDLLF
jgi:Ca2+-binding RTX toxin-like protein